MKRLYLLSLMLVMGINVLGQTVDRETARRVAETFFEKNVMKDRGNQNIHFDDITAETEFQNFYIFSADSGFVLVAGDERVIPILGYSKTSPFDTEDMPESLKGWLQGYEEQIQEVKNKAMQVSSKAESQWNALVAGEPILAKGDRGNVINDLPTWGQWSGIDEDHLLYNDECPILDNKHCKTGCVATAMAQIMRYWNYPIQGKSNHEYTWHGLELSANFGATTYDWNHMTLTYDPYTSLPEEKAAVATLMKHCGVAVEMDYGVNESSATTSSVPYVTYFDYCEIATKKGRCFYTDEEWINLLKNEIDHFRPINYRSTSNTLMNHAKHSFICYGYDDNDFFVFNWGWRGSYNNAYYAIGALNPNLYHYNKGDAAVVYIVPKDYNMQVPDGLQVNQSGNALQLSWNSVPNAVSYIILRNGSYFAETEQSSFEDEYVCGGSYTYKVMAVNQFHFTSLPCEQVSYSIPYETPKPMELFVNEVGTSVTLSWASPINNVIQIFNHKHPYTGSDIQHINSYDDNGKSEIFEYFMTSPNAGKYLTEVDVWVSTNSCNLFGQYKKHTIKIESGNQVVTLSFVPTSFGPKQIWLEEPIKIVNDYVCVHLTIDDAGSKQVFDYVGGANDNNRLSFYRDEDGYFTSLDPGQHFIIDLFAKWADELTYNIYRSDGQNTICIAKDLEESNYTDANLPYGTYTYYVTTNYYGGESDPSDYVTVSIGTGQHSITCASATHGSVSASPTSASANTTITVTATPAQGYSLSQLYYTESGSTDNHYIPQSTGQFVMPDANVTVHAEFASNELTIDNLEELIEFRNLINAATMGGFNWKGHHVNDFGIGSVFYLTNDININPGYVFTSDGWYTYTGGGNAPGVEQWTAIGQIITPPESWDWQGGSVSFIGGFGGTFEGNGHTISGLYVNGTNSYQALFSYLLPQGTIRNLTVNNAFVGGNDYSAIICAVSSGNIENCHSYGTVVSYRGAGIAAVTVGTVQGSGRCIINCTNHAEMKAENAGGICLGMVDGLIQGCTNYGSVNTNISANCWTCGGIVGKAVNGRLVDNTNNGPVRGNKAGGIVGELIDSSIRGCTNTMQITASGGAAKLGGIVGEFSTQSAQSGYFYVFSSNVNTGSIQCDDVTVGGLVGNLASGNLFIGNSHSSGSLDGTIAGGVLGHAAAGLWQVDNSYNVGAVTGTSDVGGIMGKISVPGNVYDSYNQGDVTGSNNIGGLVGYVSSGAQGFVLNNCSNSGSIGGSDQGNAGGLIGAAARKGTLTSCANTGTVSDAAVSGSLIGVISGGNWTMNSITNTLEVNGTTSGGIIGSVAGGSVTFNACSNQASLSLTGETIGGILGSLTGGSAFFNNCQNGAIIQDTYSGGTIGGILGSHTGGTVSFYDCHNNGQLMGNMVGGIMASSTSANGTVDIYDCSNTGSLYGSATAGGIVGVSYGEIEFTDCSNGESVNGRNVAGGIIGLADGPFTMSGCYNTETVQNNNAKVGGLVGQSNGSGVINSCFNQAFIYGATSGGLIGVMNATCNVTNSYNEGNVSGSGTSTSGGFFGEVNADVVMNADKNCYNTARINGNISGSFAGYISAEHVYISDWDYNYSSGIPIQPDGGCWGGIVGVLNASEEAVISNCNNRCSFWLDGSCGGIVCDGEGNLTISNCHNYGSFRMSVGSTASDAGGIIGHWNGNLTIEDCTNEGTILASDAVYAAGIVARMENGNLTLNNCVNQSAITASSTSGSAGGIVAAVVGVNGDDTMIGFYQTISNCVNYGKVIGGNSSGILSYLILTQNLDINGCYNHGNINGLLCSGIIGMVIDHLSFGDLIIGIPANINISDCHNYGGFSSTCGIAGVGPLSVYEIVIIGQSYSQLNYYAMDSEYSSVFISDCSNSGDASMLIEGVDLSPLFGQQIGGIDGSGYGISGSIAAQVTNCYNTGIIVATVETSGEDLEPYFAGIAKGGNFMDCYNTGSIITNRGEVAGIGIQGGQVERCYNIGSLKGDDVCGIVLLTGKCSGCVNYGHIEQTGSQSGEDVQFIMSSPAPIVAGVAGMLLVSPNDNEMKFFDNINVGTFNMDQSEFKECYPVIQATVIMVSNDYYEPVFEIENPSMDDNSIWISNNYYDKQMCPPYVSLIPESVQGWLTEEMLGTGLENTLGSAKDETMWSFTEGLYPRLDDSPASELGATPVFLQDLETAFALATDFQVGSLDEGLWLAHENKIYINGTTASIMEQGAEVLSLYKDGITKDVELYSANAFVNDGSWNTASNWSMNSVPGASQRALIKANAVIDSDVAIHDIVIEGSNASVSINDGFTLQPEGIVGNYVGPAGLVIKDGGQFIHEGYHVQATCQKSIEGFSSVDDDHWYTVSVPFWEVNVDEECNWNSGEYDLYSYCEDCVGEEWLNFKAMDADEAWLYQGEGYLYANGATAPIEAAGWLNDKSVSIWVGCSEREDALKGFNLIGNPFAHEIYKGTGGAIDDPNMAPGYYVLDNNGTWELKTYEDAIGVGQAILVKTTTPGEVWIEKTTAPATGESGVTRSRSGEIGLSISGEGQNDKAYVYFDEGIGLNKISNFDTQHSSLYLRYKGESFAIAHVEEDCKSIELLFDNHLPGEFTLSVNVKDVAFSYLHLIDSVTGSDIDMLQQPSYRFKATGQEPAARFKLVFVR